MQVKIANLLDYPASIPLVAMWRYAHWSRSELDGSVEHEIERISEELNAERIPLILIAMVKSRVVGMASLVEQHIEGHTQWSPWLARLYVPPEMRRQGVGSLLVQAAVEKARSLGVKELYVCVSEEEEFFQKFGWQVVERTRWADRKAAIMRLAL